VSTRKRWAVLAFLLAAPCGGFQGSRAAEPRVRSNQNVSDILSSRADAPAPVAAPADPSSTLLKLCLWAGGLLLGAVGVIAFRRSRGRSAANPGGEGIDVVGRTMISPRHSVLVLRTSGKRIAVAIAGERVTPLGMWEDPSSGDPMSGAPEAPRKAQGAGGFTIRPEDQEAISAARRFREADLVPYRKQVERLRGFLRGLKDGAEESNPQEDPRV